MTKAKPIAAKRYDPGERVLAESFDSNKPVNCLVVAQEHLTRTILLRTKVKERGDACVITELIYNCGVNYPEEPRLLASSPVKFGDARFNDYQALLRSAS
ncbi:MAG: hypothetical protein AABX66_00315 [Nanoarchaeota archaeon]